MTIEVRCIEHLSVEQRQSLHLLYGPMMGKSSICLYEFLGSIQNSVELEDVYLLLNINASQFDKARNHLEQYHLIETYIHEDDIMNQFTVMETGAGSLKPREYYQLTHKSYQKTAAATNKLSFRLENQVLTNKEVPLAEKVDSDLVKREKVEATNIATRTPGAGDVAWMMEKGKIESKMNTFESNINKIVSYGGSSDDFKNWKDIYNSLDCAIKLIRKSYLDLGSRKKEYLAIYQDIVKRNLSLTGQLRYWKSLKTVKQAQQKATKIDRQSSNTVIANNAMRRWQNAMAVDGFSK